MQPSVKPRQFQPQLADLPVKETPNDEQLDSIKAHLDLILLALEALTRITSEAILGAAKELNLESILADRVGLWRLRQSNPNRKSSGGRKKLDVEEARSLVLVICHLAHQHQDKIRDAVQALETVASGNEEPHRHPLLGDYIDEFCNTYEERMNAQTLPSDLSRLALKLLLDLLFYSDQHGHRRLWLALLDHSRS
jgi:hypothetical protein